jgi:hypothetical protein
MKLFWCKKWISPHDILGKEQQAHIRIGWHHFEMHSSSGDRNIWPSSVTSTSCQPSAWLSQWNKENNDEEHGGFLDIQVNDTPSLLVYLPYNIIVDHLGVIGWQRGAFVGLLSPIFESSVYVYRFLAKLFFLPRIMLEEMWQKIPLIRTGSCLLFWGPHSDGWGSLWCVGNNAFNCSQAIILVKGYQYLAKRTWCEPVSPQ